jgi:hypothetical protein
MAWSRRRTESGIAEEAWVFGMELKFIDIEGHG